MFNGDPNKQNLQDPQSLNAYSYAEGNPITGKDPSGMSTKTYLQGAAKNAAYTALGVAAAGLVIATLPVSASTIAGLAVAASAIGIASTIADANSNYQAYSSGAITKDQFDYNNGGLTVNAISSVAGLRAAGSLAGETAGAPSVGGTKGGIPKVTNDNAASFWYQSTFDSPEESLQYHVNEHASGSSPAEYTLKGLQTFMDYNHLAVPTTLRDGSPGLRIYTQPDGRGGYFTPDGQLVTHWNDSE